MNKKLIIIFSCLIAILFLMVGGLGYSSFYLNSKIDTLSDEQKAFETDTTNKFTVVQDNISKLDSSLNAFKTDTANKFTSVQNDITILGSNITTLDAKLATFKGETTEHLTTIDSNVNNLNTKLADLATKFAESTVNVRGVYDEAIKSVCLITDGSTLGSGFIYSADGYIITCWHVIRNMYYIDVVLHDGSVARAKVIGSDKYSDVAVLQLTGKSGLKPLNLADSDALFCGESVMVIGNPLGIFESVTYGIISRTRAMIDVSGFSWLVSNLIQIDAPTNPGNSGGPVVNNKGQVVGIAAYTNSSGEGIHYAISSNKIDRVARAIIDEGSFTNATLPGKWTLDDITPDNAINKGIFSCFGAIFTMAQDIEGVQVNDVAIAVDGIAIKETADLFSYIAEFKSVDDTITLTVIKSNYVVVDVTLTLVEGWVFLE
ncbi:MAG: trypsin-like peptidase domain-containing protein [Dehalococcoidales bacterium]